MDKVNIAKTIGMLLRTFPDSYVLGDIGEVEEYFRGRASDAVLNNLVVHHEINEITSPDPVTELDNFIKFIIKSPNDTLVSWGGRTEIVKSNDMWFHLETRNYCNHGEFNIISAAIMEGLEVDDITPYLDDYFNNEDKYLQGLTNETIG